MLVPLVKTTLKLFEKINIKKERIYCQQLNGTEVEKQQELFGCQLASRENGGPHAKGPLMHCESSRHCGILIFRFMALLPREMCALQARCFVYCQQ
ncbi:hypothetical protein CEXT_197111 [Caerostris extrusa]|uniref:Uncharacterized protein n=1 Tax=Caerostris extrusa TaxID=172846 RepID=A0AAV4QUX4_CAEEX|nr:hypothetical protein CEXT_197111 [Caerostris extrusa]